MSDIGFVGLGKMGLPILERIRTRFKVKMAYNRNRGKAAGLEGVAVAEEPFHVGSSCNIIFVILSDDAACESVIFGEKGIARTLRPQSILVNLSTVSLDFSHSAARRLQENMCSYLDAPVLGSVNRAAAGELTSLVSGPENAYKTVSSVIESYSSDVFYMGGQGNAVKMKLISNMVLSVNLAAIGEALIMSDKSGIRREDALDILEKSGAGSRILSYKKETIASETFEPSFMLKDMIKDLGYINDLSADLSSPIPIAASAMQYYKAAMSIGLGNLDFSSVVRAFKFLIGRA